MANSVDPDQTAPIGAVCSGSTLFASILNSSLMLGNYLQQITFVNSLDQDQVQHCPAKMFDTLIVFMKGFFENIEFEKINKQQKVLSADNICKQF